jgi:hypothetical protein
VATIDPGFDVRHGISARVTIEPRRFTPEQLHAFAQRLVERLEQLPQAQSVSFASLLPLGGDSVNRRAELRGLPFESGVRVGTNHVGRASSRRSARPCAGGANSNPPIASARHRWRS